MSRIKRAISADGFIRISLINSTDIVNVAQRYHHTTPVATAALGRTLTMAAIMGSMLKEKSDNLTIYIKGDGPLGGIVAAANGDGAVKGYVYNPIADVPKKRNGKLDVGKAVGKGYLSISKDLGLKEPYVGQVPLVTGEIAEDFTYYYAKSEQTPTAVSLGVLVDTDLSAKKAGGFLLQLMPDCDDETAKKIEERIKELPPITELLTECKTEEEAIEKILEGFEPKMLDEAEVKYRCDCSKERIDRALISLGKAELEDIINTDGKAELTCQFCPKIYRLDKEELTALLNSAK